MKIQKIHLEFLNSLIEIGFLDEMGILRMGGLQLFGGNCPPIHCMIEKNSFPKLPGNNEVSIIEKRYNHSKDCTIGSGLH